MSEFKMREVMRRMKRPELMMVLASYLLEEKGVLVTNEKQLKEVMEENFMDSVAMEDLRLEIINSRQRLGLS